jgi:hypothetical protein
VKNLNLNRERTRNSRPGRGCNSQAEWHRRVTRTAASGRGPWQASQSESAIGLLRLTAARQACKARRRGRRPRRTAGSLEPTCLAVPAAPPPTTRTRAGGQRTVRPATAPGSSRIQLRSPSPSQSPACQYKHLARQVMACKICVIHVENTYSVTM